MRIWRGILFVSLAFASADACNQAAGLSDLTFGEGGTTTSSAGGTGGGGDGGSGGRGGAMLGNFVDDGFDGFGEGTFDGTVWNGDHVALTAGSTEGTFISRIFDAGQTVSWNRIGWTPGGAYGKALPDGAAQETGYPRGGADMNGNILLWHFDGTEGPLADAAIVSDGSGASHDGLVESSSALTAGLFGQALDDGLGTYVFTPIASGSSLNFGTSDFSWAMWVKTSHDCPPDNPPSGNRVYMGADETETEATHLWFGCSSSTSNCPDPDGTGRAAGTFCSRKNPSSDCQGFCGRTVINDGEWHHMVVVKEGHAPGTITVYVDGTLDLAGDHIGIDFEVPVDYPADTEFTVGAFSDGTFPAEGIFDDAAVWQRALGEEEVAAIYGRGVLELELRVRVCEDADCSTAPPFIGPDGTATAYVDPAGALSPPAAIPIVGLAPGQYLQYQATFSTSDPDVSPELHAVVLGVD